MKTKGAGKKRSWSRKTRGFETAASIVLAASRRPMTIREMMAQMMAKGLVESSGKTPENTLYAILSRANDRAAKAGKTLPFTRRFEDGRVVYSVNKK